MASPSRPATKRSPGLRAKVAAARLAAGASRAAGRGGTSLPGKVLLALDSHAIGRLSSELPAGVAVISATNGKTTTAAMTAAVLERAGHQLVHNAAGANMAGGVAGALVERDPDADLGLFEVDEFWLGELAAELRPRAVLLGNLFRDQLDRYGELESIAERWAEIVAAHPDTTFVLNADDPAVAALGDGRTADVVYFGIEDPSVGAPGLGHAADAKHCRNCCEPYVYAVVFLSHLGHYTCPNCGSRRPEPQVKATQVGLTGLSGFDLTIESPAGTISGHVPLPGLYNVYNALAAAALSLTLGAAPMAITAGLAAVAPAFGRGESVEIDGKSLLLMLVKNPTGANEVLRTLALESGPARVLAVLNDRIADGRDVSWVWDADYELLKQSASSVVCSGTRAAEMAVRLKYAGFDPAVIELEPDLDRAITALVSGAAPEDRLVAIPTYTAMLELRQALVRRGVAEDSF